MSKLPKKMVIKDHLEIGLVQAFRTLPKVCRAHFLQNFMAGVEQALRAIVEALREQEHDPEEN